MMQEVLTTTAVAMRGRLGTNGSRPCSDFKKQHSASRSLTRMNILLEKVTGGNDVKRYAILSELYGREITTSKSLLYSEVAAFLAVAFPAKNGEVDTDFLSYLTNLTTTLEEIANEQRI